MFRRNEKQRIAPWLVLTVGGLAVVGATSIAVKCRTLMCEGKKKISSIFSGAREENECSCE